MNQKTKTVEAALDDLRTIDFEVDRALHSWTIFHESVLKFEAQQSSLIDEINALEIGHTFNHIQMVLLHDCVACICRVTDQHKADRITLDSIAFDLRAIYSKSEPQKIREFDAMRKSILKSKDLSDLRTFRNNELGHTLRLETPPTTYVAIPNLIVQISGLLGGAFFLFGYPRWIGQPRERSFEKSAQRFWARIERGLKN